MITESNPLKLEYVIIIFLLIIAIVLLFYKSIDLYRLYDPLVVKHHDF